MPVLNYIILLLVATFLAQAPAEARTRKGEKLLKDGKAAEAKRDYEKALDIYEQAVSEDPSDAAYQMAVRRVRFQAGQTRVEKGLKLREAGQLEEAAAEFQKAFTLDPSSQIAVLELKRTMALIEAKKAKAEGKTSSSVTPDAGAETDSRVAGLLPPPVLRPLNRRIDTLKLNNQSVRVLFETLAKYAGINVVWDPEYQRPAQATYSVDLSNTTLDQALEYLSTITKTYWKPISSNTIFLTNDNVTKRRDHEDMVVKTFYLKNLTTPQELQEVATILRAVTDIRRVFTYNAQNIVMVRGEIDKVLLAEKLVQDLDKPKGEVVIDVFVMEANRARTRDLAATFLSGGTNGLNLPISFTPRDGLAVTSGTSTSTGGNTTTVGPVRLTDLSRINLNDFAMAVPNAMLKAMMSDRGTRVMQSPQVRAIHGLKSSLKIGDRYPYATGSFQPGVGAVGVSPLVSTQFQFADVGVNVDITPQVHGADEVSMKVEVDITNIRDRIDVGGLSQPVIGQRKFTQDIRLRSGEVSLLGGLTQDQDTRTVSGTPGLASIPWLKRLFSGESIEKTQGELLIALVPHIVRVPDITELNTRGIAAGSDAVVKVGYPSNGDGAGATPAVAAAKPLGLPIPGAGQVPVVPVPATPEPAPPAPQQTATPTPPAAAGPVLLFAPGALTAKVGGPVNVVLSLESAKNVFSAPLRIKWDPKVLRLNDATRGTLLGAADQSVFTRNIRNDEGEVSIVYSRVSGASGVTGSGAVVNLSFQAVAQGTAEVRVVDAGLRDAQMQPVPAAAPSVQVKVEE
jgi:general secretion pathway protein D